MLIKLRLYKNTLYLYSIINRGFWYDTFVRKTNEKHFPILFHWGVMIARCTLANK